ncbi:MAG: DinB family protein [Leadbetterella sp.]
MKRPLENEYAPFFKNYIQLVPEGNFWTVWDDTINICLEIFENIPDTKHNFAYASDKWTIREVLQHLIDVDRVFMYRALVGLRMDDQIVLPFMDENKYASNSSSSKPLSKMLEELKITRLSAKMMYENTTEEQLAFQAKGYGHVISARAMAYCTIGHTIHHLNILNERYL